MQFLSKYYFKEGDLPLLGNRGSKLNVTKNVLETNIRSLAQAMPTTPILLGQVRYSMFNPYIIKQVSSMPVCSIETNVFVVIHTVNTDTLANAMTNVEETVIRYVEELMLTTSTPLALVNTLNGAFHLLYNL